MTVVVAYGTEKQAYFDLFMESCRSFGIHPVILGWGEPWQGTCMKLVSIRDYIRQLPEETIVLSVDPFDVIFLSGLEEIEARFLDMERPFLCGALRLQAFNARIYEHEFNRTSLPTPETPTAYNYLNAGTWISTAGYASRVLSSLIDSGKLRTCDMDQEVFTAQYIADRTVVDIDWRCGLFQNILFRDFVSRQPDLADICFSDGRIINRSTGTLPCLLHASGNVLMGKIAKSLGYAPRLAIPKRDMKNYFRKAVFHLGKILSFTINQKIRPAWN